ncbi:hypothetical protein RYX36_013993 [Vicia faba]
MQKKMSEWNNTRLKRILVDYILRMSYYDTAEKLADAISSAERNGTVPCLAGEDVFILYDTYGFPMEITKEVAEERGVSIDMNGFDIEMEKQRRQSQAAHNTVKLAIGSGTSIADNVPDTEFIGYDSLYCKAIIASLVEDKLEIMVFYIFQRVRVNLKLLWR